MALAAFQWFCEGRDKSEKNRKDSHRHSDELAGGAACAAGAPQVRRRNRLERCWFAGEKQYELAL
jgi:hypothetical protein